METACKDKKMAIAILESLALNTKAGVKRVALQAVMSWIDDNFFDIPDDPAERQALIEQIEEELMLYETPEVRRAKLAHYCKAVYGDFNILVLPPGSDAMLKREVNNDN